MLIAQGFLTLEPFDNPIFKPRGARDFWGRRWNLQVPTLTTKLLKTTSVEMFSSERCRRL